MPSAKTFRSEINEDSAVVVTALLLDTPDETALVQSDFSAIAWKLFNYNDRTKVASGTLTISSVVFNTLQDWPAKPNETGYNFKAEFSGTYFTQATQRYRMEILFTLSGGESFPVILDLSATEVFSS
jgi:hypothetical protein